MTNHLPLVVHGVFFAKVMRSRAKSVPRQNIFFSNIETFISLFFIKLFLMFSHQRSCPRGVLNLSNTTHIYIVSMVTTLMLTVQLRKTKNKLSNNLFRVCLYSSSGSRNPIYIN